jgi:hypothetical protein
MPIDYSHGLIKADLTGDGREDLLVVNQYVDRAVGATSRSYVLTFEGSSPLSQRFIEVNDPSATIFASSAPFKNEMSPALSAPPNCL